jgi:hypothetical protein
MIRPGVFRSKLELQQRLTAFIVAVIDERNRRAARLLTVRKAQTITSNVTVAGSHGDSGGGGLTDIL